MEIKSGYYWARIENCGPVGKRNYYNAIVEVHGTEPFLRCTAFIINGDVNGPLIFSDVPSHCITFGPLLAVDSPGVVENTR